MFLVRWNLQQEKILISWHAFWRWFLQKFSIIKNPVKRKSFYFWSGISNLRNWFNHVAVVSKLFCIPERNARRVKWELPAAGSPRDTLPVSTLDESHHRSLALALRLDRDLKCEFYSAKGVFADLMTLKLALWLLLRPLSNHRLCSLRRQRGKPEFQVVRFIIYYRHWSLKTFIFKVALPSFSYNFFADVKNV